MRIGFYTDYSQSIAAFAEQVGFTSMQLSAWPSSSLNADTITDDRIGEIRADLDARGIEISALGYYPNPLDVDPEKANEPGAIFARSSIWRLGLGSTRSARSSARPRARP